MILDVADLNRDEIINELTSRLSWPVEETYQARSFEIKSDCAAKIHRISWPRDNRFDAPRFLDYMHKLVHAWLAESVHIQFSEPYFTKETDRGLINSYLPVFEAAIDWFVEAEILNLARELAMAELREELHRVLDGLRRLGPAPTPAYWALSGLILAKGAKLRGSDFLGQGLAKNVVDVFLSIDGNKPCLFTLQALTRELLRATSPHDAFLVHERGFERWRISQMRACARRGSRIEMSSHTHPVNPYWDQIEEND